MSSEKKFKLNIVDLFVVIVVILVLVGAYLKFSKFNNKTNSSSSTTISYSININNVRNYSLEAYEIGDNVYDSLTGVNIGKITAVSEVDATNYEVGTNGESVKVVNPYRKDVVLTVETPGTIEENAYYANKSIELKVNSQKAIETKYAKTTGIISAINVK